MILVREREGEYFGLVDGAKVCQYKLEKLNPAITWISRLQTYEGHRYKGYGEQMLRHAIQESTTPVLMATVRVDNKNWVGTNMKCGFRIAHRIVKDTGDLYLVIRSKQFEYPRV